MKLLLALVAGLSFATVTVSAPKGLPKVAVQTSLTTREHIARADSHAAELPFPIPSTNNTLNPSKNSPKDLTVVIERPKIILKHVPSSLPPTDLIILPFHVHLTDACVDARRTLTANWTNGARALSNIPLEHGTAWSLDHKIPGYAPLTLGAFDAHADRLRFQYNTCVWFDDETWRECGECRAALWTAPAPDCRGHGGSTAVRVGNPVLPARASIVANGRARPRTWIALLSSASGT